MSNSQSVSVADVQEAGIRKVREGDVASGNVLLEYTGRNGEEVVFEIPYDTVGTPDGLEIQIVEYETVFGYVDDEQTRLHPTDDVLADARKTLSHYHGFAAGHSSANPFNDGWLP